MVRDAGHEIGLDGYSHAYFLRTSDEWTEIDYNKKTTERMSRPTLITSIANATSSSFP